MKKQRYIVVIIILCGGILGNLLRYSGRMPDKMADFSMIPNTIDGYSGTELQLDAATYEVLKADRSTYRDYGSNDHAREALFLAYFKSQKYGSQIHSPKHCLPGGGWRIESIHPYRLNLPDGTITEINRLVIVNQDYKSVMFYWYQTRSGAIRNEYGLKFDLAQNALLFRPTDAAIIRLTVTVPLVNPAFDGNGDVQQATEIGVDFLQKSYPYIIKSLPF